MGNNNEIKLEKKDLDTLSSDARISILKVLDGNPKTISELSKELGLSKSTIHQHLVLLSDSKLVVSDDSRKWHPYELTKKGERILHPENGYKIIILLTTSVLACTIGLICIYTYIRGFTLQGAHIYHDPVYFLIGEILIIVAIVSCWLIFRLKNQKMDQKAFFRSKM
ncbi:MAG: winged helix-turn-helix domain-containing protein [Methanomicrobium sp.]|jgi:DNA-binding transcriptional ArsR family regulator|nr:winged helix-turn-helix domain-containing protein [Methanomicrobium sp.]